jgi:hypothetical protein
MHSKIRYNKFASHFISISFLNCWHPFPLGRYITICFRRWSELIQSKYSFQFGLHVIWSWIPNVSTLLVVSWFDSPPSLVSSQHEGISLLLELFSYVMLNHITEQGLLALYIGWQWINDHIYIESFVVLICFLLFLFRWR